MIRFLKEEFCVTNPQLEGYIFWDEYGNTQVGVGPCAEDRYDGTETVDSQVGRVPCAGTGVGTGAVAGVCVSGWDRKAGAGSETGGRGGSI